MHSHTPDAGPSAQRALDELCCARRLSLAVLATALVLSLVAMLSTWRSGEVDWLLIAAPLSFLFSALVLCVSCQQRIRAKRRELQP